jgi:non-homologous end joining protein Ku
MAYTAWRGAIEVTIQGFPVPINVAFENRTREDKPEGFALTSPDGHPVKQFYLTEDESWKGTIGDCGRAIKVGKTGLHPVTKDTIEAIGNSERSTSVEPDSFAPLDSIDLALCSGSYAVVPDLKAAPAAARQAEIIWNGLRYSKLAYITRLVMRAGALDRMVAIYADDDGLWAVGLPWATEITDVTSHSYTANDEVGAMFAQAISGDYEVAPYDRSAYASEHKARRDGVIAQVLAGQTPTPAPAPKVADDAPDLMAVLTQAVKDTKKPKATKPRKKVAA